MKPNKPNFVGNIAVQSYDLKPVVFPIGEIIRDSCASNPAEEYPPQKNNWYLTEDLDQVGRLVFKNRRSSTVLRGLELLRGITKTRVLE